MKVRQLKKLLKEFQPILVIKYPIVMSMSDLHNMRQELIRCGHVKNFRVFFIRQPEPLIITPDIKDIDVKEFIRVWQEQGQIITHGSIQSCMPLETDEPIYIISPLKIPVWMYKARLKKLEDIVKKYDSEG